MSKKGENIYKRKDGRWEGRIIIQNDKSGHTKFHSIYGNTYKEVIEKKKLWLENHERIDCKNEKEMTINDIAEQWLVKKKTYTKASTYTIYHWYLNTHILPYFGILTPEQVNESDINHFFINKLENGRCDGVNGLSKKTVKDMQVILKNLFEFGATQYGIKNPCENIKFVRFFEPEMKLISESDKLILTEYLLNNLNYINVGILLSLFTGMRIGEVCALKWNHIDFEKAVIKVNATAIRVRNTDINSKTKTKLIIHEPKSMASKREIPIPAFILEQLRNLYIESNLDCYILTNQDIKCMEPRTYQNVYKRILKICKIDYINYHSLRHSFASLCIQKGMDIKMLSEILGHSNVNVTLNRYIHTSLEQKRKQMEEIFSQYNESYKKTSV